MNGVVPAGSGDDGVELVPRDGVVIPDRRDGVDSEYTKRLQERLLIGRQLRSCEYVASAIAGIPKVNGFPVRAASPLPDGPLACPAWPRGSDHQVPCRMLSLSPNAV